MLPITTTDLRLFLHVLAATVWVGGQVVVAGLVPVLRGISTEAPRLAARRFAAMAWPAFAVVVATGVWNLLEVPLADTGRRYRTTLVVKLALVAVSGIAAFVHAAPAARWRWRLGVPSASRLRWVPCSSGSCSAAERAPWPRSVQSPADKSTL